MQIRQFALRVVQGTTLADKLDPPRCELSDSEPGTPCRLDAPGRPATLSIAEARAVKVPPVKGMQDISQRRRILHALANHELQAAELFAWMLLAFPEQPKSFRRGILQILIEEQEHCQLYVDHLRTLGGDFGDYPVTGHFWRQLDHLKTPLDFLCVMGLTFENANLDFAQDYARAAKEIGDLELEKVLKKVHLDEVRHVAFAWRWLLKEKGDKRTPLQAYLDSLPPNLGLARARGKEMDREARVQAGIDEEFLLALSEASSIRPNGRSR